MVHCRGPKRRKKGYRNAARIRTGNEIVHGGGELAKAGPIVGDENGVAGIGRIVFDAGGLAGDEAFEANLAFETGDVLRGVIGDAGNRVAVRDQMARTVVRKRASTAEKSLACLFWLGRMLGELDDLAFGNTADLIEMKTALAFRVLGLDGGTEKSIGEQDDGGDGGTSHGEHKSPISEQRFQRADSAKTLLENETAGD